ncbi:MAG: NusG domain II-containing protein [Caldisericia bacterium]|nr:NusG domain II-containing protein [Caldisericia bacterium]
MKPYDRILLILIIILLLISVVLFLNKKEGEFLFIKTDSGIKRYPLNQETIITVKGRIGEAKIEIKDGKARFLHSPCKKKICEKRGWISKEGEYAICIPNGVFIWIGGDDLDAISE